jgi:hypothetical protein
VVAVNAGYLVTASVSLRGLGGLLTVFGAVGVAKYLGTRYGRYPRDASGRPIGPLTRGWYKLDAPLAIPLMVVGCVGVVLLIASAVK